LEPRHRETIQGKLLYTYPSVIAGSFIGGAWEKAMDHYTSLAEKWLAMHVGREGAVKISAAEFAILRTIIDDEVTRLVEPEDAAHQAEHKELEAVFGPNMVGVIERAHAAKQAREVEREAARDAAPQPKPEPHRTEPQSA
jgi:hypothetical protein